MLTVKQAKPKKYTPYVDPNSVETYQRNGVNSGTGAAVKDWGKDIWGQILGVTPRSGDMTAGQEIDFKLLAQQKALEKQHNNITPAINYAGEILQVGEKQQAIVSQEIKQEVQTIVNEIRQLASSAKELESQVMQATGQAIVKPGKYHQSFFHALLSLVQQMRVQIDNSSAWLSAMGKKNDKKQNGYWGMFKQHGTSFGMSGERSLATQTG